MNKAKALTLLALIISIASLGCAPKESAAEKARKTPDGVVAYAYYSLKERNQIEFCKMLDASEVIYQNFCTAGSEDFEAVADMFANSQRYQVRSLSHNKRVVRGSTILSTINLIENNEIVGSINVRVKSTSVAASLVTEKPTTWSITKISFSNYDKALDRLQAPARRIIQDMKEDVLGF